jgi:hypothetical protein
MILYPNISENTYIFGSTNFGQFYQENYYYLTKDTVCKIHVGCKDSEINYSDNTPLINIKSSIYNNNEKLYLMESHCIFINNDKIIDNYYYLGKEYLISPLLNKIKINILNIQTQLLLFDTIDSNFKEHEKYAINRYCYVKLKFVNSIYPSNYKYIIKSLEIR